MREYELEFSNCDYRIFMRHQIVIEEINSTPAKKGCVIKDKREGIPAEFQGIRIDKETGEITFCNFEEK